MKRQLGTVGEMIANLHWRDASSEARRNDAAFRATDVGKALEAFESTHFRAVQLDCQENVSDKALRVAWDRYDEAHRTLVTHVDRLIRRARQRGEGVE